MSLWIQNCANPTFWCWSRMTRMCSLVPSNSCPKRCVFYANVVLILWTLLSAPQFVAQVAAPYSAACTRTTTMWWPTTKIVQAKIGGMYQRKNCNFSRVAGIHMKRPPSPCRFWKRAIGQAFSANIWMNTMEVGCHLDGQNGWDLFATAVTTTTPSMTMDSCAGMVLITQMCEFIAFPHN